MRIERRGPKGFAWRGRIHEILTGKEPGWSHAKPGGPSVGGIAYFQGVTADELEEIIEEADAKIISYNEEDEQKWRREFYTRFIEPLSSDTWLVVVDYHV